MKPGWILAIVLAVLIIVVLVIIYRVRQAARHFSNQLFGTDSFLEGYRRQEQALSETPKSVSGMTKIYLPQIMKDFPEFSYPEFRRRSEAVLLSCLAAVEKKDISLLSPHAGRGIREQIGGRITALENSGETQYYQNPRIHGTEIARYHRERGMQIITFQSAVEYTGYREKNGEITDGRKDLKTQTKYNIEIGYLQDAEKAADGSVNGGLGLHCPNCGAPIESLGAKKCLYCGSAVQELNIHVWEFLQCTETGS